jgi:hypothetical protein
MTCTARESEPLELLVIPDQVGGPNTSLCGQPDTYQCPGGDCIRNDQRCNGVRWECLDNADEKNCGIRTCFLVAICTVAVGVYYCTYMAE